MFTSYSIPKIGSLPMLDGCRKLCDYHLFSSSLDIIAFVEFYISSEK